MKFVLVIAPFALALLVVLVLTMGDARAEELAAKGLLIDASHKLNFVRGGIFLGGEGLGGAAWFDYNNDDLLDLFITNGKGRRNGLFRNDGGGNFTNVALAAGVANGLGNSGVITGDINNDGCADIFLTGEGGVMRGVEQSPTKLYLNKCNGTFSDITDDAGVPGPETAWSAAFGDINNDSFLDLFVTTPGSMTIGTQYRNKLYLNNGDLTFTDISESAGIDTALGSCAVGFNDYNNDGWTDIFVANCASIMVKRTPIELFRNNGDLTFTNVAGDAGIDDKGYWMAIAFGDSDSDGDLDVFLTNVGTSIPPIFSVPHALYENNGDGTYTDIGETAGLADWEFGWGASFADFDNNGYADLFFAGSFPFFPIWPIIGPGRGNPGRLFMNKKNSKSFSHAASFGLQNAYASGVAVGDFDNNGFPDIVVVTTTFLKRGRPVLLQNVGNNNNWITVRTVGTASNRDGVGARVTVKARNLVQVKEVRAGSSFLSMDSPWLTFGLGKRKTAHIEVAWPSGLVERFSWQAVNQMVTLVEGTGVPVPE